MPNFYTVTAAMLATANGTKAAIEALRQKATNHLTLDLTAAYPNTQQLNLTAVSTNITLLLNSLQGNFNINTINVQYPSDKPDTKTVPDHWLFTRRRMREGDLPVGLVVGGALGFVGGVVAAMSVGRLIDWLFNTVIYNPIMVISTFIGALWGVTKGFRQDTLYGDSKACREFYHRISTRLAEKIKTFSKVSGLGLEQFNQYGQDAYNQELAIRLKTFFNTPAPGCTYSTYEQRVSLWEKYKDTPVGEQLTAIVFPEPKESLAPVKAFLMSQGVGAPAANQGGPAHDARHRRSRNSPNQ